MQKELAIFAMGCFWGPQYDFSKLPGVTATEVGYSGGESGNPTYHDLDGHTETVKIEYDPSIITYGELLDRFWKGHDPTIAQKKQYQSIIFYLNEAQRRAAEKSRKERQNGLERTILTEIRPAGAFYRAEEYHQEYLEKQTRSMA